MYSLEITIGLVGFLGTIAAAFIMRQRSVRVSIIVMVVVLCVAGVLLLLSATSQAGPVRILKAPIEVTACFAPSGWMGDGEYGKQYMSVTSRSREVYRLGDPDSACVCIKYTAGPALWTGVYWQYPDGNWGKDQGCRVMNATRVSFWARGKVGGELVEFKSGGTNAPGFAHRDSFERSTGSTNLAGDLRRYEIDLQHEDLSSVIGAFACCITADSAGQEFTVYVDDIRFE